MWYKNSAGRFCSLD